MKSVTSTAIDVVSRAFLTDVGRAVGFRRNGSHLVRASGNLIHGIHFQASQWGSAEAGNFTVNLVVTSRELHEVGSGRPLPKNPATATKPFYRRLGSLLPEGRDLWWDVDQATDLDALARGVCEAIARYGLPYFEEYPSAAVLLEQLRAGTAPGVRFPKDQLTLRAILAAAAGEVAEATSQLEAMRPDDDFPAFKARVEALAVLRSGGSSGSGRPGG